MGAQANSACPTNPEAWDFSTSSGSCYYASPASTTVSRADAWQACLDLDSSSQLVIIKPVFVNGAMSDGESENDFVAQVAKDLTDFWTSGLREGWEVEDPSLYPNEVTYTITDNGSTDTTLTVRTMTTVTGMVDLNRTQVGELKISSL